MGDVNYVLKYAVAEPMDFWCRPVGGLTGASRLFIIDVIRHAKRCMRIGGTYALLRYWDASGYLNRHSQDSSLIRQRQATISKKYLLNWEAGFGICFPSTCNVRSDSARLLWRATWFFFIGPELLSIHPDTAPLSKYTDASIYIPVATNRSAMLRELIVHATQSSKGDGFFVSESPTALQASKEPTPRLRGSPRIIIAVGCFGSATECFSRLDKGILHASTQLGCRYGWSVTLNINTLQDSVADLKSKFIKSTKDVCPQMHVWVSGIARDTHYLISAQYRSLYWKHLEEFDWFLNTDDDLAWTAEAIRRVAREFPRFDGTKFAPGVLIFEKSVDSGVPWHYPLSLSLRSEMKLIQAMEIFDGEWYLVPVSHYQASVLAPRERVRHHVQDGLNWLTCNFRWLEGTLDRFQVTPEIMTAHWFYSDGTRHVVPLRRIGEFLVHHTSNAYMTPDRRQDPRVVAPGDKVERAKDGTCINALGPLEMLLLRLAVFFDDSSGAVSRQYECQKTCFPAAFD